MADGDRECDDVAIPNKNEDAVLFVSDKHASQTVKAMQNLRQQRELCDVVIRANGGTEIHAHKQVLSARSSFFKSTIAAAEKALSSNGDAKNNGSLPEVLLAAVEADIAEQLVEFCYSSAISINASNVKPLLHAAHAVQLKGVQDACCSFLQKQMEPTNCLSIRAFAAEHVYCHSLLHTADAFILQNFDEVAESEAFLEICLGDLIGMISSDELNTRSEEQVFHAAMTWVRHNILQRQSMLPEILKNVRLPLCSPKFLVCVVGTDDLIKSNVACRDLVDEAKNYLLLPNERISMHGPRMRPRKPTQFGEVMYAVGGWCNGDAISSVEKFDPSSREWRLVSPMLKRRCGVGVCVLNGSVYAVGGHDGQCYLNCIERYEPHSNRWTNVAASTKVCRTSVGVAVLDNCLYAAGGQDGVSCLNIVEKYDPVSNTWTPVAPMTTGRLGVAVAVLENVLYAVGGSDGHKALNSVERYDCKSNSWSPVASMCARRKHLACVAFNGLLYAVGGRDDASELSSVECYSPYTNQWSPVVAMGSRRSGVGLAVVNGQLYACGGFDGTTYLKTCEIYDPEQNHWRYAGSMNARRLGGGLAVLRLAPMSISSGHHHHLDASSSKSTTSLLSCTQAQSSSSTSYPCCCHYSKASRSCSIASTKKSRSHAHPCVAKTIFPGFSRHFVDSSNSCCKPGIDEPDGGGTSSRLKCCCSAAAHSYHVSHNQQHHRRQYSPFCSSSASTSNPSSSHAHQVGRSFRAYARAIRSNNKAGCTKDLPDMVLSSPVTILDTTGPPISRAKHRFSRAVDKAMTSSKAKFTHAVCRTFNSNSPHSAGAAGNASSMHPSTVSTMQRYRRANGERQHQRNEIPSDSEEEQVDGYQ